MTQVDFRVCNLMATFQCSASILIFTSPQSAVEEGASSDDSVVPPSLVFIYPSLTHQIHASSLVCLLCCVSDFLINSHH